MGSLGSFIAFFLTNKKALTMPGKAEIERKKENRMK